MDAKESDPRASFIHSALGISVCEQTAQDHVVQDSLPPAVIVMTINLRIHILVPPFSHECFQVKLKGVYLLLLF